MNLKSFQGFISLFALILSLPLHSATAQNSSDTENNILDGLEAGVTYTTDIFSNVSGGSSTGIRYMDNLDLEVQFDTDRGFGWGSTEFYLYGLSNQGGSISDLVGDLQGVSNIEAETSWRFYEVWMQKFIYGIRTSVLVGLYDLNSEFDVINTATLFINSSHGIGAEYAVSGVLGPSIFPYTSVGIRIKSNPYRGVVVKAAALDGIPSNPENTDGTKIFFRERDGLLLAGEISLYPHRDATMISRTRTGRIRRYLARGVEGSNRYKFSLGVWTYTQKRIGWMQSRHISRGAYVLAEYRFFEESEDSYQGLSGFARYGLANGKVNRLSRYAGAGLVYTGLFKRRPHDQLGLAMALPFNSDRFNDMRRRTGIPSVTNEINLEATYRLEIKNFSFVQFDLQYIINPDMRVNLNNALVLGTRLQIAL